MPSPADLSVIVLAGGRSTRMGADKAQVRVNGTRLIDATLSNIHWPAVVVSAAALHLPVPQVSEQPPFGGPVAGIAAALPLCTTDLVAVMAVDAPAAPTLIPSMQQALGMADVVLTCDEGHRNVLCSLWRRHSLQRALDALPSTRNVAARRLLDHMNVATLQGCEHAQDFDTPEALAALGQVNLAVAGHGEPDGRNVPEQPEREHGRTPRTVGEQQR